MCKLKDDDIRLFSMVFNVYNQKPHYIEFKVKSEQYYCLYKEDEELMLILHKHSFSSDYHIHFLCSDSSQAISEVLQHERYIEKRKKLHKKLCGDRKIEIIL